MVNVGVVVLMSPSTTNTASHPLKIAGRELVKSGQTLCTRLFKGVRRILSKTRFRNNVVMDCYTHILLLCECIN